MASIRDMKTGPANEHLLEHMVRQLAIETQGRTTSHMIPGIVNRVIQGHMILEMILDRTMIPVTVNRDGKIDQMKTIDMDIQNRIMTNGHIRYVIRIQGSRDGLFTGNLKKIIQSYPPADDRSYEYDHQGSSTQHPMNDANNFKPESYNPSKYDSYAHQSSNSDYAGNSYHRNNDYDQRKLYRIIDSASVTVQMRAVC